MNENERRMKREKDGTRKKIKKGEVVMGVL